MPKFYCFDCKEKIKPSRYFMVKNTIWEEYGVGKNFLCLDCFKKRLGRELSYWDLTDCIANRINPEISFLILTDRDK
jgi:hypothetical protein